MKIKKENNGTFWVFSESEPESGWRKLNGADLINDRGLDPGEILSELIKMKQQEKKDLPFGMAFSEVMKENPGIAKSYQEQLNDRRKRN